MSNHFISLAQAEEMIGRFQLEKNNVLTPDMRDKGILFTSESFDKASFETLLNQGSAEGLRFYLGMNPALETRLIAVATDGNGDDILPVAASASAGNLAAADPGGFIVEEGIRCPTNCPRGKTLA